MFRNMVCEFDHERTHTLFNRYKDRELSKSGAPKTAVDFALVLLGGWISATAF